LVTARGGAEVKNPADVLDKLEFPLWAFIVGSFNGVAYALRIGLPGARHAGGGEHIQGFDDCIAATPRRSHQGIKVTAGFNVPGRLAF